jgi:hypothetical protein
MKLRNGLHSYCHIRMKCYISWYIITYSTVHSDISLHTQQVILPLSPMLTSLCINRKDEYSKAWKSISRGGSRVKIVPLEKFVSEVRMARTMLSYELRSCTMLSHSLCKNQ